MSSKQTFQVAGVDGCKGGWFVAIVSVTKGNYQIDTSCVFKLTQVLVESTFAEVLSKTTDCELVCVDIPIGLSDGDKPRECDVAARKLLRGPRASPVPERYRASSVFPAPLRQCLSTDDYKTACEISSKYANKKLSQQSFNIMDKIRQVDDLMTPELQRRVREIHPEISFWALNNKKPIQRNKKTVPGQAHRHALLQRIVTDIDSTLAEAPTRGYVMDDALDAIVAAWTAGQAVMGKAATLPENPELDSKGLRMEILCPIAIINATLK